jgi:hypothetical protein
VGSLPQPRKVVSCPDHRRTVRVLDLDPVLRGPRPHVSKAQRPSNCRLRSETFWVAMGVARQVAAAMGWSLPYTLPLENGSGLLPGRALP